MTKVSSVSFSNSALTQSGTSGAQILVWSTTQQEYIPVTRGTSRSTANSTNYWQNDIISGLVGGFRTYWRANSSFVSSNAAFSVADFANLDYLSQELIPPNFLPNTPVPAGFQLINDTALYQNLSDRVTGATFDLAEQSNWQLIATVRSQELANWTPNTQYNTGDTVSVTLGSRLYYLRKSGFSVSGATFDSTELAGWRYVAQETITSFESNTLLIAGAIITMNGAIHRHNSSRVTGATFNAAEQANWIRLTTQINPGTSSQGVAKWNNTSQIWEEGVLSNSDVPNNTITNNKLAQIAASTLIGNPTGSVSDRQTITLGTNLSFSGSTLNASGTVLPNFSNLSVLRGNGTNIPVADSRISFASGSTQALTFLPTSSSTGLTLSVSGLTNLITQASAPSGPGANITVAAGSGENGATDVAGGNLILQGGSATGTQGSSIRFDYANTGATSNGILNPASGRWLMSMATGENQLTALSSNNSIISNGNLNIYNSGSNDLNIGGQGSGLINIGAATKTTNLNGFVKRSNIGYLYNTASANTAVSTNTNTDVIFKAAPDSSQNGVTQASTTSIQIPRAGLYSIKCRLTMSSATANTSGIVTINPTGGLVFSVTPVINPFRLAGANVRNEVLIDQMLNVTTPGSISITVLSPSASLTVFATNTAATNASGTFINITELV